MSISSIPDAETLRLRKLLAFLYENFVRTKASPESVHPLNVLDRTSAENPKLAVEALLSGIDTMLSIVDNMPAAQRRDLDQRLIASEAMSESEYKARYGKSVKKILKRGHIANRREYEHVRNLVDKAEGLDVPSYIDTLQSLLDRYAETGSHQE